MEPFSLEKYLENPSRKVVTRDGRPVRILCTDAKAKDGCCIIAAIETDGEEEGYQFFKNGKAYSSKSSIEDCADLFFADEELTEFDYAILSIISDHNSHTDSIEAFAKRSSKKLLDLARKEIEKENPYSGNQKQEWSEEDEKLYTSALWHIKNSCGNGGKDSGEYEVYNWLKAIKDRIQPQPKQEWSEEDEKMCSQVINEIEAIKSNSSTIFEKNIAQNKIDWLKSIKDRVHPKQELSEEDEKKINGLVKGLEDRMGFGWASQPFTREEYIEWLKCLKDRIQPQPHWKPSKKQLMALRDLLSGTYSIGHSETYQTIESLYQDLKNYNYGKI